MIEFKLNNEKIEGRENLAYVLGTYTMTITPLGAPGPVKDAGKTVTIVRRQPDGGGLVPCICSVRTCHRHSAGCGTLNRMQLSSRFLKTYTRTWGGKSPCQSCARFLRRTRGKLVPTLILVSKEHALNERRYQYRYPRGQSRLKQS